MDRLYTCFVSSTYLDLVEERQLLANILLGCQCVPLGMEYFPSTGDNQIAPIVENIEAADFCLFIVAGRYGSVEPGQNLSWTHREFRKATELNKPVIALLHSKLDDLPARATERDEEGRQALQRFRAEVENATVCRYYRNSAELVAGTLNSVAAVTARDEVEGWVRGGPNTTYMLMEADFPHTYELVETHWTYSVSAEDPATLDAQYSSVRMMKANFPEGLNQFVVDFGRNSDRQLPFSESNHPQLHIVGERRESPNAGVRLKPPHRYTGAAFAQYVAFDPPLGQGEQATVGIEGSIARYKHRYVEDLVAATMQSASGPRTHDFNSRRVTLPTRELLMTVFLPEESGARPIGPQVGRSLYQMDFKEASRLTADGSFRVEEMEIGGHRGTKMTLHVKEPQMRRHYRLAWELGQRPVSSLE